MPKFKAPGVYIEETSSRVLAVAAVETAIPAFIGHTQKTIQDDKVLLFKPIKINSFLEFETIYGGAFPEEFIIDIKDTFDPAGNLIDRTFKASFSDTSSNYFLYHSLKLYFANGGGACYIISIGSYEDNIALGNPSSGFIGGLKVVKNETESTLLVFPEAVNLSLSDYSKVVKNALDQCASLNNRFTIVDFKGDITESNAVQDFRSTMSGDHLSYGATYSPNLKTIFQYGYSDTSISIRHLQENGLEGSPLPCEVEDFSGSGTALGNKNALVYSQAENAIGALKVVLPPSGAIAGIYVQIDKSRGVWKAPANVAVNSVVEVTTNITNVEQQNLNIDPLLGISINAIRPFIGKGILVWGSRTMAGNNNEYRYVPVRRFLLFVQESVTLFAKQFVFEPNEDNTWVTIKAVLLNFLTIQWRDGSLAGARPDDAFYVRLGLGETMTANDIDHGRMIVEIGMAVVRPAEFIILRIQQKMQS